jgi:poly-beta-1,6-N-acetyl-D-glucosamine synthase
MPLMWIFWFLVCCVLYTYLGYAALLWMFRQRRGQPAAPSTLPRITHIIAAFNEEQEIEAKIENTAAIHYPSELVQHIIITDGSTDATVAKAANAPGITHLHQPLREGKVSAINRAVSATGETEILIFSDANAMINPDAFLKMVSHFQYPHIGGVAGEKKVVADDLVPGKAEGIYWKYESWLKQLDSDFHTVVGAAGELFAIRRTMFTPVPQNVLLDDLYLSLMVCQCGKRMAYEPQAFAAEGPSFSIADEWTRRVRIGAGAFQSLRLFYPLLNVFRYGKLSFQFFSHRVMRWLVCPFALLLIFLCNIVLVMQQINPLYLSTLVLQVLFYLFAWMGYGVAKRQKGSGLFLLPFYFVFMNLGMIAGLYRYLSGNQTVRWEKSRRAVLR